MQVITIHRHRPTPPTRRAWELDILAHATHYIVSTPSPVRRLRGQRLMWDKVRFATRRDACAYARTLARALVYAVDADDRSYPLGQEDWL